MDDDVTNNKGIYAYLLTGRKSISISVLLAKKDKLRKYNEQEGVCAKCGNHFAYTDMDGDHILPWSKGGKRNMIISKCSVFPAIEATMTN